MDHQPDQVSTIVIRARDPELLVAAAAAARLAMATWPSGTVATTLYADQVDGDAEHAAVLDSAFQQYIAYNPPGVGEPARQIVRTLLSNIVSQQEQTPPLPQPDPLTDAQRLVQEIIDVDEAAEDPPASALHHQILGLPLTTQELEEPDWEACEDVPVTAPPSLTPTTTASSASTSGITTKAQPARTRPTSTMVTQVRISPYIVL